MMDNFKEIYDQELSKWTDRGSLDREILSSPIVSAFVYEVCKRVVEEEEKP